MLGVNSGADAESARAKLASTYPIQVSRPDVNGFELNILCDTKASEFFDAADDGGELATRVAKRNEHLEYESGAVIDVTATADFYNAAKNDILSGAYKYDLYAATASGNLSRLLAEGELHDVSGSKYIDFDKSYYDKNTMDSLAISGGKYLISSSAADARLWSYSVVYDNTFDGGELQELAVNGAFTLDTMLGSGFLLKEEEIYTMWFGVGGRFVSYTEDKPRFITHTDFADTVEKLSPLMGEAKEKTNAFALQTLYDVAKSDWLSILPLPKATEEDYYCGYIDLSSAVLLAVPSGSPSVSETEYLVDRMSYLSKEYIASYFEECFFDETEIHEAEIYKKITDSASCDLSVLLGYGDIGGLVADCLSGEENLTLEYYNRRALYEKALSIIAKRLEK